MKQILGYLRSYLFTSNWFILGGATCFIGLAIFCNYYFGLNQEINAQTPWPRYAGWFLVFLTVFCLGYLLPRERKQFFTNPRFLVLLLMAPALFAWKMSGPVRLRLSADVLTNQYWNLVVYWPLKLFVLALSIWIIWSIFDRNTQPLYGCSTRKLNLRPYLFMLLLMVPLIAAAATQQDFLSMYPKLQQIQFLPQAQVWYGKLLYEFSYGLDFVSIELFFRGFLVLAFCKWAGQHAILPMALFYCTIHFGKPLGECISSYFGGLILGIVTYHSGTIWGGLMVHLGIAWLMELAGYLGNLYYR